MNDFQPSSPAPRPLALPPPSTATVRHPMRKVRRTVGVPRVVPVNAAVLTTGRFSTLIRDRVHTRIMPHGVRSHTRTSIQGTLALHNRASSIWSRSTTQTPRRSFPSIRSPGCWMVSAHTPTWTQVHLTHSLAAIAQAFSGHSSTIPGYTQASTRAATMSTLSHAHLG